MEKYFGAFFGSQCIFRLSELRRGSKCTTITVKAPDAAQVSGTTRVSCKFVRVFLYEYTMHSLWWPHQLMIRNITWLTTHYDINSLYTCTRPLMRVNLGKILAHSVEAGWSSGCVRGHSFLSGHCGDLGVSPLENIRNFWCTCCVQYSGKRGIIRNNEDTCRLLNENKVTCRLIIGGISSNKIIGGTCLRAQRSLCLQDSYYIRITEYRQYSITCICI